MKKKPIVFFTIADENNQKYLKKLRASLKRFHPDIPLEVVEGEPLQETLKIDSQFFYRATPGVARDLLKQYETVVKIDADSVVTGDLSHTWDGEFDIAVVNNSNPREMAVYPVTVWNIHQLSYLNAGFVVMKSEAFVDHWWRLCTSPHFNYYQMREQDLMNIMIFYGNYKVRFLDASPYWHGLISKGYWNLIELRDDKLILPNNGSWPSDGDKEIKVIHFAGGNLPVDKMNFNIKFKEEVAEWLNKLTKDEN